ncbi:MAG: cytochrome c oxidase subunit II [Pseudomonadales bacterium]|nr:cytochrome c oxidase subunit II [Pseudomonadales bacterium]
MLALLTLPLLQPVMADELNLRQGVTEISHAIYDLHQIILWVCVVIGVLVFAVMAYSIFAHRKSRGFVPATFHENLKIEFVWTIVPMLILIGLAIPSTATLIDMYDTGGEDLNIEVRAYQWKWQYKYLDEDLNSSFSFFSSMSTPKDQIYNKQVKGENYLLEVDNVLKIPVNRKVRFLITSDDVIHAWWVPDFGIKRDAVPGMLNDLWTIVKEPGIYRGQCTELCGKDHGFMPIVVEALPEAEFDAWHLERVSLEAGRVEALNSTFTEEELMAKGEEVYVTFCASCHQVSGKGIPPVFPGLDKSAIAVGDRDEHLRIVYEGVPGTAMAAFGKQLDAAQLAAVVHYERHAWSNNSGDITQPKDVINLFSAQ